MHFSHNAVVLYETFDTKITFHLCIFIQSFQINDTIFSVVRIHIKQMVLYASRSFISPFQALLLRSDFAPCPMGWRFDTRILFRPTVNISEHRAYRDRSGKCIPETHYNQIQMRKNPPGSLYALRSRLRTIPNFILPNRSNYPSMMSKWIKKGIMYVFHLFSPNIGQNIVMFFFYPAHD